MYLDSCLHCGASHPEITSYLGQPLRHRIKCTECPHVIECFSSSIHQAKDAWNRRSDASLADAQAEIARLRGALEKPRAINYDVISQFAYRENVDYNALCALVREATQ